MVQIVIKYLPHKPKKNKKKKKIHSLQQSGWCKVSAQQIEAGLIFFNLFLGLFIFIITLMKKLDLIPGLFLLKLVFGKLFIPQAGISVELIRN